MYKVCYPLHSTLWVETLTREELKALFSFKFLNSLDQVEKPRLEKLVGAHWNSKTNEWEDNPRIKVKPGQSTTIRDYFIVKTNEP